MIIKLMTKNKQIILIASVLMFLLIMTGCKTKQQKPVANGVNSPVATSSPSETNYVSTSSAVTYGWITFTS